MSEVITEITPLAEKDCFYLAERVKDKFNYPLHRHNELELNFIENGNGARRIVGDNIEILDKYDLVLIGAGLEHGWEQHECKMKNVHELMIQFPADLLSDSLLRKNQMDSLRHLMENAKRGVSFGQDACRLLRERIQEITTTKAGFYRVIKLYELLYEMSLQKDYHVLSSNPFSYTTPLPDSRRVRKVAEYIEKHFQDDIRLNELADLVSMTPTSFSRFFKLRTGKSLSDYLIDVRLGHATRKLVDSTMSIVEICYDCGFNNVSNFNRMFKKKKKCTPSQFRENYKNRLEGNLVNESSISDKDKYHKKKEIV